MAVNLQPNVVYGTSDDAILVLPMPIQALRDPTTLDRAPLGQVWINKTAGTAFLLTKVENNISTWVNQPGGTAAFNNLTVSPGPVSMTSTLTTITGSADVAQVIYLHANGGTSETIDIHSDQGTGVASINVHSDVGGVTIASGLASADAINITASNAGGGIDIDAGTAGIIADTTGAISLDAAMASNITTTGAGIDLTLSSVGGSVVVTSNEAVATAVTVSATAATGSVTISGGGSIILDTVTVNGEIQIVAGTNSAAGAAITQDTYTGVVTLTGLVTGAGATADITVTCAKVSATSGVLVTAANLGANDAQMTVTRVTPGAGSFVVRLTNNGAAALNGNLILSFIVLS